MKVLFAVGRSRARFGRRKDDFRGETHPVVGVHVIEVNDAVKLIKALKKGEFLMVAMYDGSAKKVYSPEGKNINDESIAALFNHRDGMPINRDIFSPSN